MQLRNKWVIIGVKICLCLLMSRVMLFAGENVEETTKPTPPQEERTLERPANWESDAYKAFQRAFYQAPFSQGLTDVQLHEIEQQVHTMIREAETLRNEERYADALRHVFDAMYTEQRTQLLLALEEEKMFPTVAAEKKQDLEWSIILKDQSPLMQWLRDPHVLLEEKRHYFSTLYALVRQRVWDPDDITFVNTHQGIFMDIVTSHVLSQAEKYDLLTSMTATIQANYTAPAQYERIREQITQLQALADDRFHRQHYVEVFVLLAQIDQKMDDLSLSLSLEEATPIYHQQTQLTKHYVQSDRGPLMRRLKSCWVSYRKKKHFLWELERQLHETSGHMPERLIFQGQEYDEVFVQILSHPEIRWMTKYEIIEELRRIIKRWPHILVP